MNVIVWEWQEGPSVWVPYSPEVVRLIEDSHKNGKNIVNIGQFDSTLSCYEVDLKAMTQTRLDTELLYSIKKIKENKVIEVQRSDLVGQYLGSTTEKTKAKIKEAKGGVLFIDEAYRLIPSSRGGKDFGREAIEELMAVMEVGDPVMIFAGYKEPMEKFIEVNPGLQSRIYRKFIFPDYSIEELGKIFRQKVYEREFRLASDADVNILLRIHTTEKQRASMNARLARILLEESIEEASNRAPMDASLHELLLIKQKDIAAACARLPSITSGNDTADSP